MKITQEQFLGILRHALTFFGGLLVMQGTLDENDAQEISGAAITLAGAIWSVISKNTK